MIYMARNCIQHITHVHVDN